MSDESSPKYTFLPSMRRGLSAEIAEIGPRRGLINVNLELESKYKGEVPDSDDDNPQPQKEVEIYGPGDIRGFDSRVVVRTDPRTTPEIGDFEPNYFPFIEFAEPDFAWRYSPECLEAGGNGNLSPWITLIVLKEEEFEEGDRNEEQLPWITVKSAAPLPDLAQAAYWAHLHILGNVINDNSKLDKFIRDNPKLVVCRLMCPRRLEAQCRYTAFVIPTYKLGVCAGLGWEPTDEMEANTLSWDFDNRNGDLVLPYYFKWSFGTGLRGDFEYAVRLLEPREPEGGVGYRALDCSNPGYGLPAVDRDSASLNESHLIDMEGALVPISEEENAYDPMVPDEGFRKELARLLNRETIFDNIEDNFFTEVTASVNEWGTSVTISWEMKEKAQCSLIYEISENQNIEIDLEPEKKIHSVKLTQFNPGEKIEFNIKAKGEKHKTETLTVIIPAVPTVLPPLYGRWHAALTIIDNQESSDKPWFHQLNLDPRHRTAAGLGSFVVQKQQHALMTSAWEQLGAIAVSNDLIRRAQLGRELSGALHDRLRGLGLDDFLQITGPVHKRTRLSRCKDKYSKDMGITPYVHFKNSTDVPDAVFDPAFRRITRPRGPYRKKQKTDNDPEKGTFVQKLFDGSIKAAGSHKLPEGTRIIEANGANYSRIADLVEGIFPEDDIDDIHCASLEDVREATSCALLPENTICDRTRQQIELSGDQELNCFERIMAHPKFPQPMYIPLKEISQDLLIPGLEKIPQNSITLLQSNRTFVESFMVGFNHEFARELLWREYPTDQRGSYARQFWDPSDHFPPKDIREDDDAMNRWREKLKDIQALHDWEDTLGEHRITTEGESVEEKVVLVIRGDLLKKHPNTRIYAIPATKDNTRDKNDNPVPEPIPYLKEFEGKFADDVPTGNFPEPITPVFSGQLEPDITFLGFPFDKSDALSDIALSDISEDDGIDRLVDRIRDRFRDRSDETAGMGYFFVFEERPMEIRFGLDEAADGTDNNLNSLSNLTWDHVGKLCNEEFGYINMKFEVTAENEDETKVWNESLSSAQVAGITFQKAFRMSVHADKLITL